MQGRPKAGRAPGVSRRELLAASVGAGAALLLPAPGSAAAPASAATVLRRTGFTRSGDGWGRTWTSVGTANLRRASGEGLLEAGSDVFPNDPRPVAFAPDARFRDGEVIAELTSIGTASGVVLRRRSPRCYYAAILDAERLRLAIVRRRGASLDELAATPVALLLPPATLSLRAWGREPTQLRAELAGPLAPPIAITATDGAAALQGPGDAGVLTTAETLFPSERNPVLPALGNLHLLPWAVQEGQAVLATPVGRAVIDEIRRRSTARFRSITIRSRERPRRTPPSVVAATTGAPVAGGAELHVASDLPAGVELELSYSPRLRDARRISAGDTDRFRACTHTVRGLRAGRRVYWRARLQRDGLESVGPLRSFRVLPSDGGRARLAIASCAAQFGPLFDRIAAARPDAFVWQGDLNYPDTHGPLAQTISGYAGIWRDFLANPLLEPILARSAFVAQRDDHDYGVQDANAASVARAPWGIRPWESLMARRSHHRFRAGAAEVWVLDQRRHKSNPEAPDSPSKTLLGKDQRRWLLRTLAGSRARFKVICSPCPVLIAGNPRDGNWAAGFRAERDLLLEQIHERVSGRTIFVTGDVHLTGVYDADGLYEARAAPVGIPTPNDVTLVDPLAAARLSARPGVTYADDRGHFALLEISGRGNGAALELALVREDGVAYRRRFDGH